MKEIGNTTVVQSTQTRVAPYLGEILRQPGGVERLDQTRLKRAPSNMEDEQDNNRPRLTYFATVSKILPDLAPRAGAWQSSKILSSSAPLAFELRVLDDISRGKLIPRSCPTKQSRQPVRVPNSK